jgi:hypothetical protein
MAGTDFHVRITISSKDASSRPTKEAAKSVDLLTAAAKAAAVGFAALKTAQAAIDFAKFGASVERQEQALNSLAQANDTTGKAIVSAIQGASNFTIDRMTAMSSATKAMLLDVAKSPEQFARLTKVATTLGRAMGQDAAKSIDDFVVAAGRQSKMIADNLGLMVSAEAANKRWAAANKTTVAAMDDAAKKQAFLTEMLRQGELKTAALSSTTLDAAGKFEQMEAAAIELKIAAAEVFLAILASSEEAGSGIGGLTQMLLDLADLVRSITEPLADFNRTMVEIGKWIPPIAAKNGIKALMEITKDANEEFIALEETQRLVGTALQTTQEETEEYARSMADEAIPAQREMIGQGLELALTLDNSSTVMETYNKAILDSERAAESFARAEEFAAEETKKAEEAIRLGTLALVERKEAALDAAMSFTQFERQTAKSAKEFADEREDIEAAHAANLEEIAKKGQATRVQVDIEAEKKKLETLSENLRIALLQQSEFTEKTKESTRQRKELQIANLQEQIAEQAQLIDDASNNRLWRAGQDTTLLLEEENRRHQESLETLKTAQEEQEEAQRQSLGRILIQQLEVWAKINDIAPDTVFDMRLAISKEYGLITETGAAEAKNWAKFMQDFAKETTLSGDEMMRVWEMVGQGLVDIPTAKEIVLTQRIRTVREAETRAFLEEEEREREGFQFGTRSAPGGLSIVGERRPELMFIPPGAQINDNRVTNFNQTISTRATQANIMQDFAFAQAMAG